MIVIDLISKLKLAVHKESVDDEINKAFTPPGQAPSNNNAAKASFSERVLQAQQKFNQQYPGSEKKPVEVIHPSDSRADFGRFDPDFVPDRHLDDFDETKNLESFKKPEVPAVKRDISEFEDDVRELATATPRRGPKTGDLVAVIDLLDDLSAQNSEILRRIQRIEEKMRRS